MPTITLQDGQVVHISQESYDALKEAVKPKELTYEDIAYSLFLGKKSFYPGAGGMIPSSFFNEAKSQCIDPNNSVTENQCKQLLALNKLFNVAYFLNEGWVPNWADSAESKYCITLYKEKIGVNERRSVHYAGSPHFKSEALAQRVIAILGEKSTKECFGIFE